jgi:hypothetical protein
MDGKHVMLNTSPIQGNEYFDGDVVSGQTYIYVTTAVSYENGESTFSNESTAIVPVPALADEADRNFTP